MKTMVFGGILAGLALPVLAATVDGESVSRFGADPVPLEPLVVTPNSAAIDAISQAIVAQLLEERSWELPELKSAESSERG